MKCTRCGNPAQSMTFEWIEHGKSYKGRLCKACLRIVKPVKQIE
jgi:hypothetical protein